MTEWVQMLLLTPLAAKRMGAADEQRPRFQLGQTPGCVANSQSRKEQTNKSYRTS
jgi:hypothetical protein